MNKTAIKNFAVWARQKLIADITYKAGMLGITESGIADKLPQSTKDLHFYDIGTKNYAEVSGIEISQRSALVSAIKNKEKDINNYKEAFQYIVEEVAYTWFNRLIAVRFMEVNDYLPSGIRVLSSDNRAKNEPDFVTTPFDTDLEFTPYEQDRIIQLKDENKLDELFRMLFIKQCNKLHDILPELFEKTDDYTELLLTISFTDKDGIVYRLTHDIDEDDFNVEKEGQVEIIGWMYQYYNIEPKAAVFARAKGIKMKKEDIPAVTQLFTPDWIVRYMVENSLGRIWIEGHPNDSLKSTWKYYLDEAQQEPEVVEKLNEIKETYKELTPESIKVIDPCMGSGHILVYAFDVLMQIYESCGYTQRDAARSILENNLYGLDIDKRAYQLAYFAVMMKARQYNRRILRESIEPNLCYIISSRILHESALEKMESCRQLTERLISENLDAEEYGSVLNISLSVSELKEIEDHLKKLNSSNENVNIIDIADLDELNTYLSPVLKQSKILAQKYEVTITNPPYLSGSAVGPKLNDYLKSNYPDSKTDLFAVFMERCKEMLVKNGFQAMITMHSWMFLGAYETLRIKIGSRSLVNLLHFGIKAFEEIGNDVVQTCAFVFQNKKLVNRSSKFCRLVDVKDYVEKENEFFNSINYAERSIDAFTNVPGNTYAYWVTPAFIENFRCGDTIEKYAEFTGSQNITGNNEKYLRNHWEVKADDIKGSRWVFYAKGGDYRKYYGNLDMVVDWNDSARNFYATNKTSNLLNKHFWFREGITYSAVTSRGTGFRYLPKGCVFDKGGPSIAVNRHLPTLLGLLNSKVAEFYFQVLNPSINLQVKDIKALPIILPETTDIEHLATENIDFAKGDWNSFETSFDFKKHPLFCDAKTVEDAFENWKQTQQERFDKVKENEIALNKMFCNLYSLDDINLELEERDIPVRKANLSREIKSLISYAVGCMFGRYSLDKEGLVFAGGDFDKVFWKHKGKAALDERGNPIGGGYAGMSLAEYNYPKFHDADDWENATQLSFMPDADNCIPITDEEYFEDDIVGLFCAWLKKVYGEKTLEDNLDYIAKALGNKGTTSREIIRNYFLNDFIKDHNKIYQKRPIYWLFDSGKQNGFKALCYMHRWDADTIGNMRVEYLHRIQRVYEKEIDRMQEIIDNSSDRKEVAASTKRKEKLQKQLKETAEYDTKVAHLALSRIDIDLDDGVKVNYEKVQTAPDGKKLQILTKI